MSKNLLALTLTFALMACGPNDDSVTQNATATGNIAAAQGHITLVDGFIFKPLPGKSVSGAGVLINSDVDLKLVGARALSDSDVEIELHTMVMEDGMMRMRQVDEFAVSAGETFDLGGQGPHLMVYGVKDLDQNLEIELMFATPEGEKLTSKTDLELKKR